MLCADVVLCQLMLYVLDILVLHKITGPHYWQHNIVGCHKLCFGGTFGIYALFERRNINGIIPHTHVPPGFSLRVTMHRI